MFAVREVPGEHGEAKPNDPTLRSSPTPAKARFVCFAGQSASIAGEGRDRCSITIFDGRMHAFFA